MNSPTDFYAAMNNPARRGKAKKEKGRRFRRPFLFIARSYAVKADGRINPARGAEPNYFFFLLFFFFAMVILRWMVGGDDAP